MDNLNHLSLRLVSDREAARLLGVSRSSWWRRVADGTMPPPLKIGGATRWRADEIEAAIERLAAGRERQGGRR